MSGQLCLKWNNHSAAFTKLLDKIYLEDIYSDGTILCQGKFYPVHQFVLSTCSEYFEEMFHQCVRLSNKHPFIIVKDIHPEQMEALLNYMYKGEVNVPQEMLPELIKAAEAFKIKGLAVPDEEEREPCNKQSRKRSNASSPSTLHKKIRKHEEKQSSKSDSSFDSHSENVNSYKNKPAVNLVHSETLSPVKSDENYINEPIISHIKSEPIDPQDSTSRIENIDIEDASLKQESNVQSYDSYPSGEDSNFETFADFQSNENFDNGQSTSWDNSQAFETEEGNEENSNQRNDVLSTSSVRLKCCLFPGCHYTSVDSSNVKRHFRIHSGEKPFHCSKCSFRSAQKNDISSHEKTVHSNEKPFTCQFCPFRTAHKSSLKSHTFTRHSQL